MYIVNQKMRLISEGCNFSKICVEASKSKCMLNTNRLSINNIQAKLSDALMVEVTIFKYIGMMINNKLKFQDQIDLVNVKLSRFCGISYRLSKRLNLSAAKNLNFACVCSTLIYCLVVVVDLASLLNAVTELIVYRNKSSEICLVDTSQPLNVFFSSQPLF